MSSAKKVQSVVGTPSDIAEIENEGKFSTLADLSSSAVFMIQDGYIVYANPAAAEKVVGGIQEMIVVVNREYRYLVANQSFLDSRGLKREQVLGHLMSEVLDVEVFEHLVKKHLDECFQGKVVKHELTYNCSRWGEIQLSVSYLPIEGPEGVDRVACVLHDITEQRRAEEALRESEERYRDLVENSRELIGTYDLNGLILSANRAAGEALGFNPIDFVGKKNIRDILAPEVRHQFDEYMKRLLRDGATNGTMSVQTISGERRTWEFYHSLHTEGLATPIVRGMARDITERKLSEEKLRLSESQLFEAQQVASVGSWNWDIRSGAVTWSDELYRIFGLQPQEIELGTQAIDLIHPEDRDRVMRAVRTSLKTKEPYSFYCRIRRPDGAERIVHTRGKVVCDEQGDPIRVFGAAQDITEHQQAEAALRQAEQKYRDIFDNAGEGSFQSTPDGTFIAANPELARIHGFDSAEEFIRSRTDIAGEIYCDPKRGEEFQRLFDEQGVMRGFEHQVSRKDGSKIWVTINARALRDQQGKVLYYEGTTQDISERKRAEARNELFSNLARKLSGARTQPDAARIIADTADELFGWDSCNLDLYDAAGDLVYPILNVDTISGQRVDVTVPVEARKPSARNRRIINQGSELILREEPIKFDDDAIPFGDESKPSASLMGVRICYGDNVIGLLAIYSYAPRAYASSDLRDLQALATYCGEALNRIRTEESLRESEERYRTLFESAKDAYYVHDLSGRYISVNRAAEKLSGYPRSQIIGRKFSDFVASEHLPAVNRHLCQKLMAEGETTYETETIASDGRRVPVEVSSHLIYENGVPVKVQGTARDITERKRAEEALRQSEREYRRLFENAHDAILIINPEREIILEVNARACEIYGISHSEFVGMSLETISKDVERGLTRIRETLESGASHEFETIQRRGDGSEMFMHINASVVEYKGQTAIQSINRDITEQKRAEEALRQSEERFSKAFHSSPAALSIALLEDGRLLEVNQGFLRMTGFSRDEVIGRSTLELGLWESQHRMVMANALREHGVVHDLNIRFRKKSGEIRDGLLSVELIQLGLGELSVLATAQDVTDRNRAEEALQSYPRQLIEAQEAERQSVARELHDQIGQVLTAIHLNLQAAREICQPVEAKALIDEGVAIVDEAIDQVRNLSFELRPSLLDDLGLVTALRWYADRFAQRSGIHATAAISLADAPERLSRELETACFRIVQEALTNVVRHAKARNVAIKLKSLNGEIRLSVKDDGTGFDLNSKNLAPFTAHLGLRGMRERALAIGGRLEVRSSPSSGTVICAIFPNGSKKAGLGPETAP